MNRMDRSYGNSLNNKIGVNDNFSFGNSGIQNHLENLPVPKFLENPDNPETGDSVIWVGWDYYNRRPDTPMVIPVLENGGYAPLRGSRRANKEDSLKLNITGPGAGWIE